jgi:hypothetical protein
VRKCGAETVTVSLEPFNSFQRRDVGASKSSDVGLPLFMQLTMRRSDNSRGSTKGPPGNKSTYLSTRTSCFRSDLVRLQATSSYNEKSTMEPTVIVLSGVIELG